MAKPARRRLTQPAGPSACRGPSHPIPSHPIAAMASNLWAFSIRYAGPYLPGETIGHSSVLEASTYGEAQALAADRVSQTTKRLGRRCYLEALLPVTTR